MPIDWPRFVEIVRSHERFLLTSHIRPDCDALGSELGMAGVLEALGKEVPIVNGQATPPNLQFIDPRGRLEAIGVDVQPADLADREVLMVLDTSAWAQLGPMADVVRATAAQESRPRSSRQQRRPGGRAVQEHRSRGHRPAGAGSGRSLGVALTPEIAMPLFAAIATDTGWFRFGSTTGDTLRFAGRLVDAGAEACGNLSIAVRARHAGAAAVDRARPWRRRKPNSTAG